MIKYLKNIFCYNKNSIFDIKYKNIYYIYIYIPWYYQK